MLRRKLTLLLLCSSLTTTLWILFSKALRGMQEQRRELNKMLETMSSGTYVELKVEEEELGNLLFSYAALREFAASKDKTPIILPDYQTVASTFKIKPTEHIPIPRTGFTQFKEMKSNSTGTLYEMKNLKPGNISLDGSFQSPTYFTNIRHEIRKEFKFQDHLVKLAREFRQSVLPPEWFGKNYTQVAIYVKREDKVLHKSIQDLGYNFPPNSYFKLAISYFTSRYDKVQFIVSSDDIDWCTTFLSQFNAQFIFLEAYTDAEDLAILSHCDHAVTTVGSFSWWMGWLCNGTTLYYEHYFSKPSWSATVVSDSHYIPRDEYNNWISIRHKNDKRISNNNVNR